MEKVVSKKNVEIIIIDLVLLAFIYLLPSISHIISFPLYLIDPMRIVILGSLLILGNKKNAYILALTIPLFSFMFSGHPIFTKNILISIELITNIFVFFSLRSKINNTFISILSSIVISKLIYYGLKYLFVIFGILEMEIISTSLLIQLIVALSISILFSIFYSKN